MKKLLLLSLVLGNIAFGAPAKKVALLMSNKSNEFFSVLEKSFVKEAEKLGYKVDVYDLANYDSKYIELTGNFAQDVAQNALEAKLSALNPKGKYIVYNENDVMAIGSIGAIQNDNRFDLANFTIIGFDGSAEGKKLVDKKKMAITVVQDFEFIGKEAAVVMDNYLKNSTSPENYQIPIQVVMYPENSNPRK